MNGTEKERSPRPRRLQQVDPDIAAVVAVHGVGYLAMLAGIYKDEWRFWGAGATPAATTRRRTRTSFAPPSGGAERYGKIFADALLYDLEKSRVRCANLAGGVCVAFQTKDEHQLPGLGAVGMFNERIEAGPNTKRSTTASRLKLRATLTGAGQTGEDERSSTRWLGPAQEKRRGHARLRRLLNTEAASGTASLKAPNHVEIAAPSVCTDPDASTS